MLLVGAAAALVATNLACVHRMRRLVLTFEFIIATNERGRGGAGFGLAGLVGRSCGEEVSRHPVLESFLLGGREGKNDDE